MESSPSFPHRDFGPVSPNASFVRVARHPPKAATTNLLKSDSRALGYSARAWSRLLRVEGPPTYQDQSPGPERSPHFSATHNSGH
jgi:hypothetical protein